MVGKYVLSCHGCNTEYIFKGIFKKYRRNKFGRKCPNCGGFLSTYPLSRTMITMDLRRVPAVINEVIVNGH